MTPDQDRLQALEDKLEEAAGAIRDLRAENDQLRAWIADVQQAVGT